MQGLSEGRIVHYVLAPHDLPEKHQHKAGTHRPAIVLQVWSRENGCSNLSVFTDHDNDGLPPTYWATSRTYSEDPQPGTWHWPEKV
jgi:hypothetical protein